MMRTEVVAIDPRASGRESRVKSGVDLVHERLVHDTAPDCGLIGHDDRRKAGAIQETEGIGRPGKEHEQVQSIDVTTFLDDRAVAIEEHRWPHQRTARPRSASTAVYTRCGVIRVMHRWSIGHSRSMHGRHHTGCVSTSVRPPALGSGLVSCSRVGPKMATTGVPTAAATCMAPESLATQT